MERRRRQKRHPLPGPAAAAVSLLFLPSTDRPTDRPGARRRNIAGWVVQPEDLNHNLRGH